MAQPKRKTESRRAARRQAGRRVPVSNVAGRLVIMLALVAAVVFGVAVFFKVSRVEVQGNSLYSAEQVVQASGIETGDNLLTLNKATVAGNIITQLPYVEKVSVGRSMPDAVILEVQESTARFAVMSDTNVIWLINSSGKALERYDGLTDVTAAQTPTDETPVETPTEEAAVEAPAGEMPADTAQLVMSFHAFSSFAKTGSAPQTPFFFTFLRLPEAPSGSFSRTARRRCTSTPWANPRS